MAVHCGRMVVPCVVTLIWWAADCFVPAMAKLQSAQECDWTHMNPIQQEYHQRHLKQMLDPVRDSAILLARQGASGGGNSSILQFASRLMRVHDALESSCHDHHWEEVLSHKICASYIRWQSTLEAECHAEHHHVKAWGHSCICLGLQQLIIDCRHHVLPWAHDSHTCEHILNADCRHTHPLGGLCAHRSRLTRKRLTRKQRIKWKSSHSKHNTQAKHTAWSKHAASEESRLKGEEYIERVRRKGGTKGKFNHRSTQI